MRLEKQDRPLFFSLWIAVGLFALLWKEYPRAFPEKALEAPRIELGQELAERFSGASITVPTLGRYTVELKLDPAYQKKLGDNR